MLIPALLAARQEVSDWKARAAAFQAIYPHTPNVFAQLAELSQDKVTLLENYIEALQRVDLMMRQRGAPPFALSKGGTPPERDRRKENPSR